MTWTYIAQRVNGEFLDWDLPITVSDLSWQLSGPGSLRGTAAPDTGGLRAADGRLVLEEWGTFIYAEADGEIRWGGIVISSSFEGENWNIEAAGFSTYPHGIPYLGEFNRIGVDPTDAMKEIWRHVQSYPDGNLGLAVNGGPTPVRLGTPGGLVAEDGSIVPLDFYGPTIPENAEKKDPDPYLLAWYEAPDCGTEIDNLAKATPFDYVESHAWLNGGTEEIEHRVDILYPRAGRRREDLAFIQGDNISNVVSFESNGDEYANEINGLGAGEGPTTLRRTTAKRDGRLRRAAVYSDKAINDAPRLDAIIADELELRRGLLQITSVDVADHPNAPIGSWAVGDDILIRCEVPWLGYVETWCRIIGWSLTSESTATLDLARSDSFRYGG